MIFPGVISPFKRVLCFLLFVFLGTSLYAQIDNIQYIPPFFATDYKNGVDVKDQWIVLSTPETSAFNVNVSIGENLYRTVSISKSSPDTIFLGSGWSTATQTTGIIKEDSLNTVLKAQGFVLEGEKQFFAAIYQRSGAQGDILTCKGQTALGQLFYSGHIFGQNSSANERRSQMLTVMAVFDNTQITFSNPRARWLGQNSHTFTITLDKYESYALGASYQDIVDMSYIVNDYNGTKVESSKPIVVNSGSWCGSGNTGGQQDMGIDQLVPANFTGKSYVAVQGYGTATGEKVIVVATAAGTTLRVNGSYRHTFNSAGEYYVIGRENYHYSTKNMSIEASENVYVYQTISGRESDVSVGLCFMPPLSCLGNRDVNISFANRIGTPWLNLVTEKGATITINGKNMRQSPNSVPGNSDWVSYRITDTDLPYYNNPPTDFEIKSTAALNAALSFSDGAIGGAGFYSGFGISPQLDPKPNLTGTVACFPDNVVLEADGYQEYTWYHNNEEIPGATASNYTPTETGQYKVRGHTNCGTTKASDPYIVRTCLSVIGGESITEGEKDSTQIIFRLGLPSDEAITFWYRTTATTATEGKDYTGVSNYKTFQPGEFIDTIYIPIIDDPYDEADEEQFIFEVYYSDNATIQNPATIFTIVDNDATPKISIENDVRVAENEGSITFKILADAWSEDIINLNYSTIDSNAVAGVHYTGGSGHIQFQPGENLKNITFPIKDNDIYNEHRYFKFHIQNISNAVLAGPDTRYGIIMNDEEAPPCISISDTTATEGDSLFFDISMNKSFDEAVTFSVVASNYSTSPNDILGNTIAHYSIAPGDSLAQFALGTVNDKAEEADEAIIVELKNVTVADICNGKAVGTILNNDYIPQTIDDVFTCPEDGSVSDSVLLNDQINGDWPINTIFGTPANGKLSMTSSDGTFTYTPDADYFGVDEFTYSVQDSSGDVSTAKVIINVEARNDVPTALNDTVSTKEDIALDIYPLRNDYDADKKGIIIEEVQGESLGTVINHNSHLTFTPYPDVFGNDTLLYIVQDLDGDKVTAYIYLSVDSVNEQPVLANDTAFTYEDVADTIKVLANDVNHDPGSISITSLGNPSNGSAILLAGEEIIYTPAPGYYGTDSFTYEVTDEQGDKSTASVFYTIEMVNNSPTSYDDDIETNEDQAVEYALTQNDVDIDGYIISLEITTKPVNGVAEILNDTILKYTPHTNYFGSDELHYKVTDHEGGISNIAIAKIDIKPQNDLPTACNLDANILEEESISFSPLECAVDIDQSGLALLRVDAPNHGVAEIIANTDSFNYTPATNYFGTDTIWFTIADGEGDEVPAYATVSINNTNDHPLALNDTISLMEDAQVSIDALQNDYDADKSGLTIVNLSTPEFGTANLAGNKIIYEPNQNYFGTDSILYTIKDGENDESQAYIFLTIRPQNDKPIANANSVFTHEELETKINVLSDDLDIDLSGLSINSFTQPANGTVWQDGDSLIYLSHKDFYGTDTFIYSIVDGEGDKDSATVKIRVDDVNDIPLANNDTIAFDEDTPTLINAMANDYDADKQGIQIIQIYPAAHGKPTVQNGQILFNPEVDYYGQDEFIYTIADTQGDTAQAKVLLTINPVNDVPIANNDTLSTLEDNNISFNLFENDYDADKTGIKVTSIEGLENGSLQKQAEGMYTYTPNTDYNGVETFTYTIEDAQGDTDKATVEITIISVNDTPLAINDTIWVDEDSQVDFDLFINDYDPDHGGLTVVNITKPLIGTLTNTNNLVNYAPRPNYHGNELLEYTLVDAQGDTAKANIIITVNSINENPIANNDSVTINEEADFSLNLLANDEDPDWEGIELIKVSDAMGGDLNYETSGTVNYTAHLDWYGTEQLNYIIRDAQGDKDTANFTIQVIDINDQPLAVNDTAYTNEDIAINIPVLENDVDKDRRGISISQITQPENGLVNIEDTSINYTPDANYHGIDEFSYAIKDMEGDEMFANVTVQVKSVNDMPVAQSDSAFATEDVLASFYILANDEDPDMGGLEILRTNTPAHGTVTIEKQKITYLSDQNYFGPDSVLYVISDAQGDMDSTMVHIMVLSQNDYPIAQNDTVEAFEDVQLTIYPLANDSDVDGTVESLFILENPKLGKIEVSQKEITYTPNEHIWGTDTITYIARDNHKANSEAAQIIIHINSVNDAPIARQVTRTTNEENVDTLNMETYTTDPDQSGLTLSIIDSTKNGKLNINGLKLIYEPKLDFFGNDTVSYSVRDGEGDADTAMVYYNVINVNDVPSVNSTSISIFEDQTDTIDVMQLGYDPDRSGLTLHQVGGTQHGQTTLLNNKVIYQPMANYFGTDSLFFTISDGEGDIAKAGIKITIHPTNDAPIANNAQLTLLEDHIDSINIVALGMDIDKSGLNIVHVDEGTLGSTSIRDSFIVFQPHTNVFGAETFDFVIADGEMDTDTAQLSIEIISVNDAPIALADSYTNWVDETKILPILENDYDVDESPFSGALEILTVPANGNAQIIHDDSIKISYSPTEAFLGYDSIQYRLIDTLGEFSEPAWAVIFTDSFNYVPTTVADAIEVNEDTPVTFDVIANDSDQQGDSLWASIASQPKNGSLQLQDGQQLSYTPNRDYFGADSAYYFAHDAKGGKSRGLMHFNVLPVNDAPVLAIEPTTIDYVENSGWLNLITQVNISDVDNHKLDSIQIHLTGGRTSENDSMEVELKETIQELQQRAAQNHKLKLGGQATLATYTEVLESFRFKNDFDFDTLSRTLNISIFDGQLWSDTVTITVNPINENDAPINLVAPLASGWILPDSTLSVDNGTWNDLDGQIEQYKFQWLSESNDSFEAIAGATSPEYTIPANNAEVNYACYVWAVDNGYPQPGLKTQSISNTLQPDNYKPVSLMANTAEILRTSTINSVVASLSATDPDADQAHSFEVIEGMEYCYTDGNSLKLTRGAVHFQPDTIHLRIRITDNGPANLFADFQLSFVLINDLMPFMAKGFPQIIETTGTGVKAKIKADKPGTIFFAAIPDSIQVPTFKNFMQDGDVELNANTEHEILIENLNSQSYYKLVVYMADTIGTNISEVSTVPFTTRDITNPEFLNNTPVVHNASATDAEFKLELSELSTVYYGVFDEETQGITKQMVFDGANAVSSGEWHAANPNTKELHTADGLETQMRYRIAIYAEDTAYNHSMLKILDFATLDEKAPEHHHAYPQLLNTVGYRIIYAVSFDEAGKVLVSLNEDFKAITTREDLEKETLYNHSFNIAEDSVITIETDAINMDGNYNLNIALVDSAGNISEIEALNFTYPQPITWSLYPTLTKGKLVVDIDDEAVYRIVSPTGSVVQTGTLKENTNTIIVEELTAGVYIFEYYTKRTTDMKRFIKISR